MLESVKKLIAMVLVFSIISNSFVLFTNGAENSSKKETTKDIEKAEKESIKGIYAAFKENDEVTVSIWLNVNENKEVDKKVKKKTGFDYNNLSVIDDELVYEFFEEIDEYSEKNNAEPSKEYVKAMKDYMKATEKQRKKEKENTELFLAEYRNEMKNEVNNIIDEFIQDYFFNNIDRIIYADKIVPLLIVDVDKKIMKSLEKDLRISSIELTDLSIFEALSISDVETSYDTNKSFEEGLEECKSYTGINSLHEKLDYRGEGVKVGIMEGSTLGANSEIPSSRLITNNSFNPNTNKDHVEKVSCILAGKSGIAPKATVYSVGTGREVDMEEYSAIFQWFIENEVSIVNQSAGYSNDENFDFGYYHEYEKYFDFIVKSYRITIVQSAGNDYSERIVVPGLASNVITVGACDHVETANKTDDIRCDFSSYYNYETGAIAKPDILAQGIYGGVKGTSLSAPYVTGIIALMADIRPSIIANPQLIKAILMASCQYKAKPAYSTEGNELMISGLTERQGAGIVDPYLALCITGQKNYFTGTVESGKTYSYYLTKPSYGSSNINFSLAWLNLSLENRPASTVESWQQNLGLSICKNSTSNILKSSNKTKSSTEMVYLTNINTTNNYIIMVRNWEVEDFSEFAVAWCTNGEHFNLRNDRQGIFCIKNKANNSFLTTNNTNSIYSSNNSFQRGGYWIMRPLQANYCLLQSALEGKNDYDYLGKEYLSEYNESRAVCDGDENDVIGLSYELEEDEECENGSISLFLGEDFLGLSESNYGALGKYVKWDRLSNFSNPDTMYWYLNRVDYKEGDGNLDYNINATDANLILNIASKKEEPEDNLSKYLCDANGDNVINASDVLLVLEIAADIL